MLNSDHQSTAPAIPGTPPAIQRIKASDKRIINGQTDVNQLVPFKYKWAWEKYLATCANHWMPQEVNMARDVALWKAPADLSGEERAMLVRNLGIFVSAASLAPDNIVLAIYRNITAPECRQFLLRQAFEEAVHTSSYQHIIESLGLDEEEIAGSYQALPSVEDKEQFLRPFMAAISDPDFRTATHENAQVLLKTLIVFGCLMQGLLGHVAYAQVIALGRQAKMAGTAEQFQFILRDESMHCNFATDLINQYKTENPLLWTPEFKQELRVLFHKAVALEIAYAEESMPTAMLDLNAAMFGGYLRQTANRRAQLIGLEALFPTEENPLPWLSAIVFFETRVIEHQSDGALSWD
ncbi:ribonucleotide-diphosphate reductase subunit beta [Polaromonas sp.]|uniref:ribonucleotide-diphosphate reductase subunit beta n=1 Tax=Polaromonas sp. TaxID=1869339 RepID=UPI00352B9356